MLRAYALSLPWLPCLLDLPDEPELLLCSSPDALLNTQHLLGAPIDPVVPLTLPQACGLVLNQFSVAGQLAGPAELLEDVLLLVDLVLHLAPSASDALLLPALQLLSSSIPVELPSGPPPEILSCILSLISSQSLAGRAPLSFRYTCWMLTSGDGILPVRLLRLFLSFKNELSIQAPTPRGFRRAREYVRGDLLDGWTSVWRVSRGWSTQ